MGGYSRCFRDVTFCFALGSSVLDDWQGSRQVHEGVPLALSGWIFGGARSVDSRNELYVAGLSDLNLLPIDRMLTWEIVPVARQDLVYDS